jgi:SRSO17 transposase
MDILDHPQAQALLDQATVHPKDIAACAEHLVTFAQRYLPFFYRQEQRDHALTVLRGKLSALDRKTTEPIATFHGQRRRNLQLFGGAGGWDDRAVLGELHRHVAEELGDPEGVFLLDASAFPKSGRDSCGVARQWCGRLGKVDNCQLGVFLAYVSSKGHAPLDRRLYLPKDWASDPERRKTAHVPEDVVYQKTWEIAAFLLQRSGAEVPHGWVVGDDEFGRASEFRTLLRARHER